MIFGFCGNSNEEEALNKSIGRIIGSHVFIDHPGIVKVIMDGYFQIINRIGSERPIIEFYDNAAACEYHKGICGVGEREMVLLSAAAYIGRIHGLIILCKAAEA